MRSQIRTASAALFAAVVLCVPPAASAQSGPVPGQIVNATVDVRTTAQLLDREMQAAAAKGTVWVGYNVPSIKGRHQTCVPYGADGIARVMLESPTEIAVMVRFEAGQISRVRVSTPECVIDAGGMPVIWLQGVAPDQSVRWLENAIAGTTRDGGNRNGRDGGLQDGLLSALAFHAGDDATRAMVTLAKSDTRPALRSRALFWLSQRASADAVATIRDAVNDDPETEVKRKAVFALSQLPADQGVPLLIQVARTHPNRAVKQQAMFWLGQSKDPRAVSFFEEVLTRR